MATATHVRLRVTPANSGSFQISATITLTSPITGTVNVPSFTASSPGTISSFFSLPSNISNPYNFNVSGSLTVTIPNANQSFVTNSQYELQFGVLVNNAFSEVSNFTSVPLIPQSAGKQWTGSSNFIVTCTGSCFVENTLILTDKGYVNVQDLKKDDIIITHDNRQVPIKAVICTSARSTPDTDPFLYKAHCFSENYPPIDTYLSPHHAIMINDKWDVKGRSDRDLWTKGVHLKYNNFLNENIKQVKIADSFNYYHIYLPDFKTDHLVINHGLVVESYGMDYHITHTPFPEDRRVFIVDLKKKTNI